MNSNLVKPEKKEDKGIKETVNRMNIKQKYDSMSNIKTISCKTKDKSVEFFQ